MVYVPEILNARLIDNMNDRSNLMELIMQLKKDEATEHDPKALEGIQEALKDTYYEYQALGQENREIRMALKLINGYDDKKKKRASSLATGRLISRKSFKSHASL